jgi:hypothetical protein
VGSNGILECNFPLKNAHRAIVSPPKNDLKIDPFPCFPWRCVFGLAVGNVCGSCGVFYSAGHGDRMYGEWETECTVSGRLCEGKIHDEWVMARALTVTKALLWLYGANQACR